ncbi:hypothetical protein AGDE_08455 [Angomonas deanei]|uniref:Uncharacterized ACR, YggU family COG1872, putative n=1 Tax=Angomonas deanei TaxID=59799 RepID=A0A7G2C8G2_9TRYP|nr:hypothetical protein AGDE_08455 [Angomonas deanei]CAD2215735.1 Uncharacterised ACR, YggU family COG1872, putative [Angomonas deanei]|eukprot:EPY32899.1 hypothetical protein AGDE_08455 [Angomonas deanei]
MLRVSSFLKMALYLSSVNTAQPHYYYTLSIHAKPGARSSSLAQVPQLADEAVEVRIAAPPVEGQANAELVDFIGETLEYEWRALKAAEEESSKKGESAASFLETYLKDTSYRTLMDQRRPVEVGNDAAEKGKKKKKGDGGKPAAAVVVPKKVAVALAKGTTSKNKMLTVEFPAEYEVVVALIEKAAKE